MKIFKKFNELPGFMRRGLAPSEDGDDLEELYGGYFYLCETTADVDSIPTSVWNDFSEEFMTLGETPDIFDICERKGEYVEILLITSNSGGDLYFIPEEVTTPNLEESLLLTSGAYAEIIENGN